MKYLMHHLYSKSLEEARLKFEDEEIPAEVDAEMDSEEESSGTQAGEWNIKRMDGEGEESEDSNKQGMIRTVKGAHLVFKRQSEEGAFDELWIYNIGDDNRTEIEIRRDILAATDIEPEKTKSEDGKQSYEMWTKGNVQYCFIKGLSN